MGLITALLPVVVILWLCTMIIFLPVFLIMRYMGYKVASLKKVAAISFIICIIFVLLFYSGLIALFMGGMK